MYVPVLTSSTTVGSKSTKMARGTCFPAPVSLKNVLNESSQTPTVLSDGICSGKEISIIAHLRIENRLMKAYFLNPNPWVTRKCCFSRSYHSIGLNSVFQAVQFPAGVAHLDTSLSNVNRDDFPHVDRLRRSATQRTKRVKTNLQFKRQDGIIEKRISSTKPM